MMLPIPSPEQDKDYTRQLLKLELWFVAIWAAFAWAVLMWGK